MLQEQFEKHIKECDLITDGDKMLLAVSGGVDSMVLMSLCAQSDCEVAVAHCNFQLRDNEAEEDEKLVEEYCAQLGIKCFNKRFDTLGEMERTGESVQIAARRLRYEWFAQLCDQHGYDSVAIAHHADDSIETFFINLFRGTGLKGLTGISKVRGRIIRPLLFASRKEILDYALQHKIPFREDSSNRSTKYLRNKIRIGLVPRLREISPRFTELMTQTIDRLSETQIFIDRAIELVRAEAEQMESDLIVIDPQKIDKRFPMRFVLFELLNSHGFKGDVIDQLERALASDATGKRFYGREKVAYVERGKIVIAPIKQEDSCEILVDKKTLRAYCSNSALYFSLTDIDNVETLNVPENIALLDADKLTYPLVVRRWNDGDKFMPLGMEGHKKVSDYLTDKKVSTPEKARQIVVLSGNEIVWVVGHRISDDYRITNTTENILRIVREII